MEQERGFVSISGVASRLGVSPTTVRKFERQGLIPRGQRLEGSQSRIWPVGDVELMAMRIAEQRGRQKESAARTA